QVALHIIRELAAGEDIHPWARSSPLFVQLGRAFMALRKIGSTRKAHADVWLCSGAIHDEILTPAIKHMPVRVGKIIGDINLEFMGRSEEHTSELQSPV